MKRGRYSLFLRHPGRHFVCRAIIFRHSGAYGLARYFSQLAEPMRPRLASLPVKLPPKGRLLEEVRLEKRVITPCAVKKATSQPAFQPFSANAPCRCRTGHTNSAGRCTQVPRRSRQHWTRTQTTSSATLSSRSADIQFPATRWNARGFRCPGRICRNEIRRSAWHQATKARNNLKSRFA